MTNSNKNISIRCKGSRTLPYRSLKPFQGNLKELSEENAGKLKDSILKYGWRFPVYVWNDGKDDWIHDGHGRLLVLQSLIADGYTIDNIPVADIEAENKKEAGELLLALNSRYGEITEDGLYEFMHDMNIDPMDLDMFDLPDIDLDEFREGYFDEEITDDHQGSMSDEFGVAPFSVLNTREGWWQDRKRRWLSLGIKSEEGRGDDDFGKCLDTGIGENYGRKEITGVSIFDPVLCELAYSWFCPTNGVVLDPFAGGSVRGIVASHLGRKYIGVELRLKQVLANKAQVHLAQKPLPIWKQGDSRDIANICKNIQADFIFSCPPYASLEVYSDDPQDISTLEYDDFKETYFDIIAKTCKLLKKDRFACFVVGEVRDKKGIYYDFVSDTISAFTAAGLDYYNEAILVTAIGTLPIRAGRMFRAGRKLGKTHQNILVFCKGSPKKATEALGDIVFIEELGIIEEAEGF